MKKAVCLLSGGLDSCVVATIAKKELGYDIYCLTVKYGQRHSKEIEAAKEIAKALDAKKHIIVDVDLNKLISVSSLINKAKKLPEKRDVESIGKEIPSTYVPARNIIFLSLALAYAENIDAEAIFIGANAVDWSGYPDCRPEFIDAFKKVVDVGTKRGVEGKAVEIKTPIINLSKDKIIKKGVELKAPLELTWSCYKGDEKACGKCDSCLLRLKGFKEAGYRDPLEYEYLPEWYTKG
jgi:7-cyano-7-deazaguanine synthase